MDKSGAVESLGKFETPLKFSSVKTWLNKRTKLEHKSMFNKINEQKLTWFVQTQLVFKLVSHEVPRLVVPSPPFSFASYPSP